MKFTFNRKRLRGLTMLEGLLWFGLLAIVIGGIIANYLSNNNSNKVNKARQEIQTYIAGVKGMTEQNPTFVGVTNPVVIAHGSAPRSAVRDANTLINPWGGTTTIAGTAATFTITYAGVPSEACAQILTSGLVGSGAVISIASGGTTFTANPTPAQAITACTAVSNNIVFTSR